MHLTDRSQRLDGVTLSDGPPVRSPQPKGTQNRKIDNNQADNVDDVVHRNPFERMTFRMQQNAELGKKFAH